MLKVNKYSKNSEVLIAKEKRQTHLIQSLNSFEYCSLSNIIENIVNKTVQYYFLKQVHVNKMKNKI